MLRAGFGGANFDFGLAKSGIGGGGETLGVFEGEEFFVRLFLGPTETGENRFKGLHVAVVMHGHLHLIVDGSGRLLGRTWQNSSDGCEGDECEQF